MKRLPLYIMWSLYLILFSGCDGGSDSDLKLEGGRYQVRLTRAVDEKDWVEVKGIHEWWFFKGGVFRQLGSEYVEPQFYGESQACNGSASGSYDAIPSEENKRILDVTITYDGSKMVSPGLCRMVDRFLQITLQPSGAVDILDDVVVQRLEKLESL